MHLSDNLNHSKRFPSMRRGGKGGWGPSSTFFAKLCITMTKNLLFFWLSRLLISLDPHPLSLLPTPLLRIKVPRGILTKISRY